ncbi:hypothetical protein [Marininema halotolerans]|nr:hypothetical protein [Marininema halotolerans]
MRRTQQQFEYVTRMILHGYVDPHDNQGATDSLQGQVDGRRSQAPMNGYHPSKFVDFQQ